MLQNNLSEESIIQEQQNSDLNKATNNKSTQELCDQQIQAFYQVRQRLKKFIEETQLVTFEQNDSLNKYILKLKKYHLHFVHSQNDLMNLVDARLQRINKNKKILKNWNIQDKKLLNSIVLRLAKRKNVSNIEANFKKQDWEYVSSLIPGTNSNVCMFKWLNFHKTSIYQANWSQQQSEILRSLVQKYVIANKSIRWKEVCKKLYFQNQIEGKVYRTPKQCKQHWNFKLNSNFKRGPWSQQQDILLFKTVKQNSGIKKWVQMVKLFQGRTQYAVKNRYNLIIQKQKKFLSIQKEELELVQNYLQRCYIQKFNKIIEPDDVEQEAAIKLKLEQKRMKKIKQSKKQDSQMINLQPQKRVLESDKKVLQIKKEQQIKRQYIPQNRTTSQIKIQMKSVTSLYKQKNQLKIADISSLQNIYDHNAYDHRANDIDFDFMDLDS